MPVTINGSTGINSPGGDVSTSLTAGSVTTSGTNSVAALTVNSNNISAVNSLGFRNRIINGDMRIDQRYAGASGAVLGAAYVVDRWRIIRVGGTSTLTVGQSSVAPTGFSNSFLTTVGSGATPATTEERSLSQPIEGFNAADLGWGAAGAQSITISFWVQSSVTGTYGLLLGNGAGNRGYVASYTINSANTWEYKTVTVAGDTSGTWLKTNGNGLTVYWDLGTGPTYSGSVTGAWQASYFEGLTGGTKLSATTGATFYITGVQLEAGTVATPFERRDYGRELMMCQRYYFAEQGGEFDYTTYLNGSGGFTLMYVTGKFPVPMRAAPTLSWTGYAGYLVPNGGSAVSPGTDAPSALPTSGAPGSVVTSTGGISRASFTLGAGVTRGSTYKNCFGTSLACSAEL